MDLTGDNHQIRTVTMDFLPVDQLCGFSGSLSESLVPNISKTVENLC